MRRTLVCVIILFIIQGVLLFWCYLEHKKHFEKNPTKEVETEVQFEPQINAVDLEMLEIVKTKMFQDLIKYNYINELRAYEIIKEIKKNSSIYNVKPEFLYAVLWRESRFRNDVEHKRVFVKSLKKDVQAVGMGAIIWEFWGQDLKQNTSLKEKDDLNIWKKNIEATAYILGYLKTKPKLKERSLKESVTIRYYGKYAKYYTNSIIKKTSEVSGS